MRIGLLSRVLDLVCPRACAGCGCRLAAVERSVCSACLAHLPRTDYGHCPQDNPVARLFWVQMRIERAAALFFFVPHSDSARLIYGMKYRGKVGVCRDMGRILAGEYSATGFFDGIDAIVPVPLARGRRRERGYNQSEELARGLAEVTGLPLERNAVERTRFSVSQTRLSRAMRMENVEGLFRLTDGGRVAGRHVLLVDDVITSGATVMACAAALMQAGGVTVSVLTLSYSRG